MKNRLRFFASFGWENRSRFTFSADWATPDRYFVALSRGYRGGDPFWDVGVEFQVPGWILRRLGP